MTKSMATIDDAVSMLRALPIKDRIETIIYLHSVAAREFATLVLEHVKAEPAKKRPASRRKLKRRQ